MKEFIDKLAYISIQDRKVLVTLSKGKDVWYIPGGKRESDETDIQALTREVYEELSVVLKEDTVEFFGEFYAQAHGKPEGTIVRMRCYIGEYTGKLTASAEIAELDYFPYDRKFETSLVDHLIFDDLKEKGLIQ